MRQHMTDTITSHASVHTRAYPHKCIAGRRKGVQLHLCSNTRIAREFDISCGVCIFCGFEHFNFRLMRCFRVSGLTVLVFDLEQHDINGLSAWLRAAWGVDADDDADDAPASRPGEQRNKRLNYAATAKICAIDTCSDWGVYLRQSKGCWSFWSSDTCCFRWRYGSQCRLARPISLLSLLISEGLTQA